MCPWRSQAAKLLPLERAWGNMAQLRYPALISKCGFIQASDFISQEELGEIFGLPLVNVAHHESSVNFLTLVYAYEQEGASKDWCRW